MNISFKKLSALVLASAIAVLGVVAPAQAVAMNDSTATSSPGNILTTGTNTSEITVASTVVTPALGPYAGASVYEIQLPSGWSFTDSAVLPAITANGGYGYIGSSTGNYPIGYIGAPAIPSWVTTSISSSLKGWAIQRLWPVTTPPTYRIRVQSTAPISAGTTVSVTFGVGSLNVAAARTFTTSFGNTAGYQVDTGPAVLGVDVNFDANGGTGSMDAENASTPTALTSNAFTKSGYTFAGWNKASDGSGASYADGATYPFALGTTLYAQWTVAIVSVDATFDANGGTGSMSAQSASTPTALTPNGFTKSGYTFAGWNTAANGSGTSYADGATFPFSLGTTLYAQWTLSNDAQSSGQGSGGSNLGNLASTGFDGTPFLACGTLLTIVGFILHYFGRRRRSN